MSLKSSYKSSKQYFILLFTTPSYQNYQYRKNRDIYLKNIQKFHQFSIVKKSFLDKSSNFSIKLILDKKNLWSSDKISWSQIKKICSQYKINGSNLSLYSDYNPQCSKKTFGFKDKEKALDTLKQLKTEPLKYQLQVITTMVGRAKYHPHKTSNMEKAIEVFEDWLQKYHNLKNNEKAID